MTLLSFGLTAVSALLGLLYSIFYAADAKLRLRPQSFEILTFITAAAAWTVWVKTIRAAFFACASFSFVLLLR
jgi:hypothetical protein